MKTRLIILFSLLNIAALVVGFFLLAQYLGGKLDRGNQSEAVKFLGGFKTKNPSGQYVSSTIISHPTVVYKTNAFHWSQVETNDYRAYIANLRGIGCPERTIKDIILTDVLKLYAARRGQFYQNGRAFKFWETDEKRKLKQKQLEERETQLAAIDKELPAVLRELLGINYERELDKYFVDSNEDDRRLAFLSEDKRDQVLALRDEFEGKQERLMENAVDGQLPPDDLAKLKKIQKEREAALAKILSAEEMEEYELTTSPTADRLRRELIGFNPSEAEFREIFQRQQAIEAKYAFENLTDETVRAARAADEETAQAQIKSFLGQARATEFDRAQNEDYRTLCVLSERFDLPSYTTQAVADMRQVAELERSKLLANKQISPERREQALKAIQTETERNVRQALGEKVFGEYSQSAGGWMKNLGAN